MKLVYKLLLGFVFLSGGNLLAQTTTYWPYSICGIGDITPKGFGQSRAMGGTGIAMPCESSLNNVNPACLQGIDSLAFLMEAGWDARMSKFTDGLNTQDNSNINFNSLDLGFRLSSKWACSIGLYPYSTVGANITMQKTVYGTLNNYATDLYTGNGGVNQFCIGNSLKLSKNFSLGLNISYLFGSINQTQETSDATEFKGTLKETDNLFLSKFVLDYGFLYSFSINKNIQGNIGAILSNPWELGERHESTKFDPLGDTVQYSLDTTHVFNLPLSYGLGVSLKLYNKARVSFDYTFSQWSHTPSNNFNVSFVNSNAFHFGAEYLPSEAYNAKYLNKITYRIGARYGNTNIMTSGGQQLTDRAVSCGFGFPILRNRMDVNFAFEYGSRGASGYNIVNETYSTAMLSFTLHDIWFVKRRFD